MQPGFSLPNNPRQSPECWQPEKEVPVSTSDVSINGVGVRVLDLFPSHVNHVNMVPFLLAGIGNDGACLHHDNAHYDSAHFYGA